MDDDREAFEFAHALYLARQVDREATQMIVEAAEAGFFFMSAYGRMVLPRFSGRIPSSNPAI